MLRQERRVSLCHIFEDLLAVGDDLAAQLTQSDPDPESTGGSLNLHTGLDDRPASPFVWSGSKTIAVVSAALQSSRTRPYFTGEMKIDRRRKGSWGQRQSWGKRRDRQESTKERQQKVTTKRKGLMNKINLRLFDMSYPSPVISGRLVSTAITNGKW